MLEMVVLYMPQFLIYTFPFATLTSSSMVLGDMASNNELLAIKSLGIENRKIFTPLIIISLILSICTFLCADILHPYTSAIYKEKLSFLMAEMPTMEIQSNSVNSVGNVILKNGKAEGSEIYDIILLTKDESNYDNTVLSDKGKLEMVDSYNYVYSLSLEKPTILITDSEKNNTFSFSKADNSTFFLDFSSQIPSLTSSSPVNLSSKDLLEIINEQNLINKEDVTLYLNNKEDNLLYYSSLFFNGENENNRVDILSASIFDERMKDRPLNYYGRYYESELTKKIALSLACFFFTLLTLPLSSIRVKHGKLTGFAIALLIAVVYWYMLFGVQLVIFDITLPTPLIIMLPDILVALISILLLYKNRKSL